MPLRLDYGVICQVVAPIVGAWLTTFGLLKSYTVSRNVDSYSSTTARLGKYFKPSHPLSLKAVP
jgi:hypothetical protein